MGLINFKQMKKIIFFFILILFFANSNSQTIKRIASYDNTTTSSSGIIGIGDTAVYEYSWYYHQWLPFTNNGLTRKFGLPVINEIACFNNESVNPSGIYVISDTAVFVYNYYVPGWLPLKNTGLCRQNGLPVISDISGYKETSSGDNYIFVISDTATFYYEWYSEQWYPLSNNGLSVKKSKSDSQSLLNLKNYPNPSKNYSNIEYILPKGFNDNIKIALFDNNGNFIKELINEKQLAGKHIINLNLENLKSGTYFYEISSSKFKQAKQIVVVE